MSRLIVLFAVAGLVAPVARPSAPGVARQGLSSNPGVVHVPPVDGPVIDGFRPPAQPWLPGNRGLEYDTEPGEPVRASAAGVVVFAGAVAGSFHVTIRHDAHLVTTVAFVASPLVEVGARVRAGDVIALAGDTLHFTARADGEYVDPTMLFAAHAWVVRLIPDD